MLKRKISEDFETSINKQRPEGRERDIEGWDGTLLLEKEDTERKNLTISNKLGQTGGNIEEKDEKEEESIEENEEMEPFPELPSNMYLDTVDRTRLDFDFEKLCSISLSNLNVYACLICGKYFQGIPAVFFAIFFSH